MAETTNADVDVQEVVRRLNNSQVDQEDVKLPSKAKMSKSDPVVLRKQHMQIISQMLMLEQPTVTSNMVNYLSQDEPCSILISFITRLLGVNPEDSHIHDGPNDKHVTHIVPVEGRDLDQVSADLLKSFRATMLLTNDDSSDELLTYIGHKSQLITKCIFTIFQKNSQANLRHGCRIIDHLMRFHLDDMLEVIGKNPQTVKRYMGSMLTFIQYAPVAEVFLNLVCKPHSTASLRFYSTSPSKKWMFFRSLSEWKLLLVLSSHITSEIFDESHTIAAADVFLELLDRLAADENGELLLQPAVHCPELLEGLISMAVNRESKRTVAQRTAAMKCVLSLLQKSVLEKVQGPPTSPYQSFGSTVVNLVPNQLAPLRDRIFARVETHMGELVHYLLEKYQDQQNIEMNLEDGSPLPVTAVRHTGYVVKVPFTELRLTLVESLVEIVAQNPALMSEHFDQRVWRVLLSWFFEYAHNNLYHAAFYQLVFIALRSEDTQSLEVLMKKLKLVTTLIDHYKSDGKHASNRGYILQVCNAIRLQAACQAPDSFLRNFLQSHTTWRNFETELREQTNLGCQFGLGFTVPASMRPDFQKDTWQMIGDTNGIDHGSEFAKSLGFVDDVAWPDDDFSETSKKKKKKQKNRKSSKKTPPASSDSHSTTNSNENDDADEELDEVGTAQANAKAPNGTATANDNKKRKKRKKKGKKLCNAAGSSVPNSIHVSNSTMPATRSVEGEFRVEMMGTEESLDLDCGKFYTEYILCCSWTEDESGKTVTWNVKRRYREFCAIDILVRRLLQEAIDLLILLLKYIGSSLSAEFVDKRQRDLGYYITSILHSCPLLVYDEIIDSFLDLKSHILESAREEQRRKGKPESSLRLHRVSE